MGDLAEAVGSTEFEYLSRGFTFAGAAALAATIFGDPSPGVLSAALFAGGIILFASWKYASRYDTFEEESG